MLWRYSDSQCSLHSTYVSRTRPIYSVTVWTRPFGAPATRTQQLLLSKKKLQSSKGVSGNPPWICHCPGSVLPLEMNALISGGKREPGDKVMLPLFWRSKACRLFGCQPNFVGGLFSYGCQYSLNTSQKAMGAPIFVKYLSERNGCLYSQGACFHGGPIYCPDSTVCYLGHTW